MVQQYLRACSLIVADQSGNGIELAGAQSPDVLRIRFSVSYMISNGTPPAMVARIYNLSPQTIQNIVALASKGPPTLDGVPFATSARVTLQAGYVENLGMLFQGQIYQMRAGKESNVDSYLDIFAAAGAWSSVYSTMNTTFAKGYTATDLWNAAGTAMSPWQVGSGSPPDGLPNDPSPRGRVAFGMTRDHLNVLSNTYNFNWNVLDGNLEGLPKFSVRPGEAIKLDSYSGLVGVPEQTENGVTVTCLLNPAIRWGTRIRLDNTEIAQLLIKNPSINASVSPSIPGTSDVPIPPLNTDGDYVVIYARHRGDTRGTEWYTHMTCLSIDPTAQPPQALQVPLPPPISGGSSLGPT